MVCTTLPCDKRFKHQGSGSKRCDTATRRDDEQWQMGHIKFDVMGVRKPLLSTSAVKRPGESVIFIHDHERIISVPRQ